MPSASVNALTGFIPVGFHFPRDPLYFSARCRSRSSSITPGKRFMR